MHIKIGEREREEGAGVKRHTHTDRRNEIAGV